MTSAPAQGRRGCLIAEAGVADRIALTLVRLGSLPSADRSFYGVFSKNSLIHVEHKHSIYGGILWLPKPGRSFAASDWFAYKDAGAMLDFTYFREIAYLEFALATVQRQVPPPLAPMTTGTTRIARATPYGLRNCPGAAGKTSARPCQPLPATAPGPRQITGSNPLPL